MADKKPIDMNKVNFDRKQLEKAQHRNFSIKLVSNLNLSQKEIDRRFKYYFSIPQPPQKSQAWLDQRTNYITASAFGNAIAPEWSGHRNELLKNKVSRGKYNSFHGNEATRWGEKYEDVANAIYCYREKVTVEEFGLIPHPDFPFLGASTDGISSKLINLEIKCPFSRKIKPGDVKPIYWKQMQLQMAVLDLELTHFLECTFQEYPSERDFWMDFDFDGYDNQEKGIIIELVDHQIKNLGGEPKTTYHYSPMELCENQDQMRIWYKQSLAKMISSPTQIYIRTHFWVLPVCSCVNVIRDREWFDSQIPKFVKFWEDVEGYRRGGGLDKLTVDIEQNKPKKNKIKIDSPGKFTLELSDNSNELPGGYILSSSDEDLPNDETDQRKTKKQKGGCLIDSSSDEQPPEQKQKQKETISPKKKLNLTPKSLATLSESETKVKSKLTRKTLDRLDTGSNNSSAGSIYNHSDSTNNSNNSNKSETKTKPKIKRKRATNTIQIDISNHYDADTEDDDSSGSDDTNDSPPMRPPSKKVFYRRKKKKSPTSSTPSPTKSRSPNGDCSPENFKLEDHTISLIIDDN